MAMPLGSGHGFLQALAAINPLLVPKQQFTPVPLAAFYIKNTAVCSYR